jgi:hypothetical protein
MYKKSCFTSQNYRFILNLVGSGRGWLEVVGGGRLEGPEKTIDLGKSLGEGFIFYNIYGLFDPLFWPKNDVLLWRNPKFWAARGDGMSAPEN